MSDHSLRNQLGDLLRACRATARSTQDTLAREVGGHQSLISRVERGHTAADVDLIERLFAGLGLQLRLAVEPLGSHLDDEIARLSILPIAQRLENWDSLLSNLASLDAVLEGPLAALLQGVPVPADGADITIIPEQVDDLVRWLEQRHAQRWSTRWHDFGLVSNDPRQPGALIWRIASGTVRARFCAVLPDALTVCHEGIQHRVRPLAELQLADPLLTAVVRRYAESRSAQVELAQPLGPVAATGNQRDKS